MRKIFLSSISLCQFAFFCSPTTADELLFERFVYEYGFRSGIRVASCDVDGDRLDDIIVAPGPGIEKRVRVFGGNSFPELSSFLVDDAHLDVDLSLGCGDIDGNGTAEVVLAFERGGPATIKVFDGISGELRWSDLAWPSPYRSGIRIAVADRNLDGLADIYAAQQESGYGDVKVFSPANAFKAYTLFEIPLSWNPEQFNSIVLAAGNLDQDKETELAYRPGRDSVHFYQTEGRAQLYADRRLSETIHSESFLALGDIDNDGHTDVVVAAGSGAGPYFVIHSLHKDSVLARRAAYAHNFPGGVYVAAGDVNGDGFDDVITGPGATGGPHLKVFSGKSLVARPDHIPRYEFRAGVPPLRSASATTLPSERMTSDGPGIAFPYEGTVTATFQLLSGRIEVFDRSEQRVLASKTIPSATQFTPARKQLHDVTFENNPKHKLDLRVYEGEGFRGVFVRPGIGFREG